MATSISRGLGVRSKSLPLQPKLQQKNQQPTSHNNKSDDSEDEDADDRDKSQSQSQSQTQGKKV